MANEKIIEFYNNYNEKHLKDYLLANKRLSIAIKNLTSKIPTTSKTLLDIGCGIGWSSHEFARHFNQTSIIGIDLSPQLIDTAEKLFNRNNLKYEVQDVSQKLPKIKFDVMVLIDVYEHISIEQRNSFHSFIKDNIADNGRILIACPSIYHQNWLRKNNPEGLQPIDENITINDLKYLADYLDSELTYFEYKSIWRNCDYFHAVIQKKINYIGNRDSFSEVSNSLETHNERINRVKSSLKEEFDIQPYEKKKTSILKKIISKLKRS